jgi:cobalt-zinc-cadmium efflux system membrane fusion protein
MKTSIFFLIFSISLLIQGCGEETATNTNTEKSDPEEPDSEIPDTISIKKPENGTFYEHEYMAQVEARTSAKISLHSPFSGYVRNLTVIPGQRVVAGEQILLVESIEWVEIQEEFLVVLAELEYARKNEKRSSELYSKKPSAKKTTTVQ